MKPHRRVRFRSLVALSATLGVAGPGCSRPAQPAQSMTAAAEGARCAPSATFESSVPSIAVSADRRAQRAWCSYLVALYRRASPDGTPWLELGRCNTASSTAAPEMLERTAACSRLALDGFDGDPFTDAYAAEVKRCGSAALLALALPADEVGSYVAVVCDRASACGHTAAKDGDCRSELSAKLGKRLGLAVGALSPESRITFRRCLQTTVCQPMEEQISTCLEPMLDRLLWMPG